MITNPNSGEPSVLPKRGLAPVLIPVVVLLSTLSLLLYSVLPILRASRYIEIVQVMHVQGSNANLDVPLTNAEDVSRKNTRTVQAAGWLEAEPFYIAATALADGVVEEIFALEGDRVEKGQILARMVDDDAKLRLARDEAELLQAQATHSKAQVVLKAAQENWSSPYELERAVSSGQASIEAFRAELSQLTSLIRVEESLLVQSQEELKSIETAYERKAAAEIEFITAREQSNAQSARLESIKARMPILHATIDRAESDLLSAVRALELRIDDRARLDSARASLDHAYALVVLREVQRDESRLELDRMTIHAPISGYVQRRLKVPGDKVVRMMDSLHSSHIAHLYDPSKLQVRVDVPLADASEVYVGQSCEVVVEVFADRTFKGEVLRVTNEADLQKNTLQVKVRVINPDPLLCPEMLTRVKFLSEVESDGSSPQSSDQPNEMVRVPRSSIENRNDAQFVWVITDRANGRGILQPVNVATIETIGDWVTVQGVLQPGAMIAVDPNDCISGERVRLRIAKGEV